MAKINGSLLLVYINGVVVAAQSSVTFNVNQETYGTSTKDSGGWLTHDNGQRSFDVIIDGLVSTTGLSATELIDLITNRKDILLVIQGGFEYPYVMKANVASLTVTGPSEEAITVSGNITGTGVVTYMNNNLVTTLGDVSSYNTFTTDGIAVTSAINASGSAEADSNNINVTDTNKYMVFTYLNRNSGQLPTIGLYGGAAYVSNQVVMDEGANFITLTANATDATSTLRLSNSIAANYSLTNTYVWEITT